ncbi:ribosome maturation factor RimM [Streptomyces fuscigenes]|uniref:ribosome maturation factor RimM n=1 Tax=Streptomyces fuscigenes TaxID=1528880 RepID=UPI001EEB44B0|nr:ribosome maturation factor RimM [Streptomyces fuscigenes]MCF3962485.1 ribosome maturation factor RimM [Streptomyces fuscigenes]
MQLVVARVGRAHGVRGEVTVEVRTDEPELRLGPGAVLATDPAAAGPLTIATGRVHSGRLLLRFEGVGDRGGAEALRNVLLIAEVDPEELPEDPDEFYDHQLMDLDVVLADGTGIGRITEISHLPSQDLLIVERPDGSEVMIPFVEEIVTEIDLEEQRAVVAPPPGLIDPAQAEVASARDAEEDPASAGDPQDGPAGARAEPEPDAAGDEASATGRRADGAEDGGEEGGSGRGGGAR